METRKLSYQEMGDFITGATILGCGGGGDAEAAKVKVEEIFKEGKDFRLLDPKYLEEESWVCILGHMGGGIEQQEKDLVQQLEKKWEYPLIIAAKELSDYLNINFDAFLPGEIGAGNTVNAMYVAAMEGKPIVDGDAIGGRARPEMVISTTHLLGIPITPLAITTHFGDSLIVRQSLGEDRVEKIGRYLARASGGMVAVARCPARGKTLLPAIHRYAISLALEAGKVIREKKECPVELLIKVLNGTKRFVGYVESFSREEREGFMYGNIGLKGGKEYLGQKFKIWFKNENLIAWRNDRPDITCPDAIIVVDSHKGTGLNNWGDAFYEGREVTVIGVPSAEIWKSEKGLEVFGPRHFGFEFSHVPTMKRI